MTDEYQRIAPWYDLLIDPFNRALRPIGLSLFQPAEGARVLEVGCGTGTQLAFYQDQGYRVAGIDLSPAMLQVARGRLAGRSSICRGDAARLPYPDDSFDLVLAALVLHEMAPPQRLAVLEDMSRVLARNGHIGLIDYHPRPKRSLKGYLASAIIHGVERAAGRQHYANYRQFLRDGGVPMLAERLGLSIERRKHVSGGNIGIYQLTNL
ncbi:MAG: methyltransferase domain-containing protein [Desulfobacterales bacterium]|jgi:demethylmenaquinone methyltransferase/2-methoxy-6-polyprenyl-1,4-benzoquinol methylase